MVWGLERGPARQRAIATIPLAFFNRCSSAVDAAARATVATPALSAAFFLAAAPLPLTPFWQRLSSTAASSLLRDSAHSLELIIPVKAPGLLPKYLTMVHLACSHCSGLARRCG